MNEPLDQLEMELRALGRRLGSEQPNDALMQRAKAAAGAVLAGQVPLMLAQQRRKSLGRLVFVLVATLPIPGIFLWADWTAVSSILHAALPQAASQVAAGVYLWLKVCALTLIYGLAVPALLYVTLKARNDTPGALAS
jgi:hypothetical protein